MQASLDTFARYFENDIEFNRHMGMKVEGLKPGWARVHLPYRASFLGDPHRPALHGGVTSFLADACGGLAVLAHLVPDGRCSTLDIRIDYLRPGKPGDLWAEAKVIRIGNRVAVVDVDISQEHLIAQGRAVYNLHQPKQAGRG